MGRDAAAEGGGNGGDGAVVDVDDKARLGVKEGVVLFVLAAKVCGRKGDLRLRKGASGGRRRGRGGGVGVGCCWIVAYWGWGVCGGWQGLVVDGRDSSATLGMTWENN